MRKGRVSKFAPPPPIQTQFGIRNLPGGEYFYSSEVVNIYIWGGGNMYICAPIKIGLGAAAPTALYKRIFIALSK